MLGEWRQEGSTGTGETRALLLDSVEGLEGKEELRMTSVSQTGPPGWMVGGAVPTKRRYFV